MSLPILHLAGDPYTQGHQQGIALGDRIAENLDVYFDRFEREAKLTPAEVRRRAAVYEPVLRGHPYFDGLRGIADASGQPLLDILALNVRYELMYYQFGVCGVGQPDGCTAFAVLPATTANRHLVVGQNWDWIPEVRGAVLHTRDEDGIETLGFSEAGVFGSKIGLNGDGLGLAINGMVSSVDDWSRPTLPFHVRCYDILRSRTVERALEVLTLQARPCAANFLIAQAPHRAVNVEAAPETLRVLEPAPDMLVHANHFLDPGLLGVEEPPSERRPHSFARQSRMQTLLDARRPVALADLQAALRDHDDHPDGICRHENDEDPPEERYITVTSVIMDLDERSLWLTDGQPCEHLYEGYSLAHTALLGR